MNKIEIYVSGMHCRSCEVLLERSIRKIPNVHSVEANEQAGLITVFYLDIKPNMQAIETTICENGYVLGKEGKLSWLSSDASAYLTFFLALGFIGFMALLFSSNIFPDVSKIFAVNSAMWIAPLFIGLAAGISSCMAVVGGLILGLGAKWNKNKLNASRISRFIPHVWLNLGRVVGFAVFGAILGMAGSILQISTGVLGLLTILVAIVMFFLGINLTELSPRLSKISFTLPKFFGSQVDTHESQSSGGRAFILGALTFFLPCGFTFAMQLAAMQSGNALSGALIMGLFALGTAPGLLGVGALTSLLKGKGAKALFRFMGTIVLLMAFYNLSNGLNLLPAFHMIHSVPTSSQTVQTTNSDEPVETIRLTYTSSGLSSQNIALKKGKNYKIIIDVKDTISGCMSTILIPGLDEHIGHLDAGNTIEFNVSPANSGKFPLTCAMGISHGYLIVQ